MELLIILGIIVAAVVVWKMRVPIIAKVLGQPEHRIERRLNQRKR